MNNKLNSLRRTTAKQPGTASGRYASASADERSHLSSSVPKRALAHHFLPCTRVRAASSAGEKDANFSCNPPGQP